MYFNNFAHPMCDGSNLYSGTPLKGSLDYANWDPRPSSDFVQDSKKYSPNIRKGFRDELSHSTS